jgi:hypothetical protein
MAARHPLAQSSKIARIRKRRPQLYWSETNQRPAAVWSRGYWHRRPHAKSPFVVDAKPFPAQQDQHAPATEAPTLPCERAQPLPMRALRRAMASRFTAGVGIFLQQDPSKPHHQASRRPTAFPAPCPSSAFNRLASETSKPPLVMAASLHPLIHRWRARHTSVQSCACCVYFFFAKTVPAAPYANHRGSGIM